MKKLPQGDKRWNSNAYELARRSIARHEAEAEGNLSYGSHDWHSFSQIVSELWATSPEESASESSKSDDGVAISDTAESLTGTRLGRYEIVELVGCGGFGMVFRARDQQLQRDVAIKIPRPERVMNETLVDRFLKEARLAAVLRHPGIVQVIESRRIGPITFIVNEFCDGPSLHDWLQQQGPLAPREAATLLLEVADAVGFAHHQGVVHQDLKSANILLDQRHGSDAQSFAPRITDFGLAFRVEEDLSDANRLVGGTLEYMAPEQRGRIAADIAPPADVYALGILLRKTLESPTSPRDLPSFPRDLAAIYQKCTRESPRDRYQNGWELRDDLQRFVLGDPVRARPIAAREAVVRWIHRRPALAVLSALLLVVVITAIIGLSGLLARERHLRQLADRRQQEAEEVVDTMLTRYVHQSMLKDVKLTDDQTALLEQAVQFYENLAEELPSDDRRRHKVSIALHRLSEIHAWRGFTERAIEIRQQGIEILSDLVAKYPDDNEYRYDDFYNNLCVAELYRSDRADKALPYRERAGQQIDFLTSIEPNNMIYQEAQITYDMGMLDSEVGWGWPHDQQCSLADSLEGRIRRFVDRNPRNVNGYRKLEKILSIQSYISICGGEKAAALAFATEAVVAARQVVSLEPMIWQYQDQLATAINARAKLEKELGDDAAAEQGYLEALSILEPMEMKAKSEARQSVIARSEMYLAELLARSGRTDEARARFQRAGRIWRELCDRHPDNTSYAAEFAELRNICPYHDLLREFE